MPQPCAVSQRRFLVDQICCSGFQSMPSTASKPWRPPLPVFRKNWTPCCRNRWSAWPGTGGRHPSESMVAIARITQATLILPCQYLEEVLAMFIPCHFCKT